MAASPRSGRRLTHVQVRSPSSSPGDGHEQGPQRRALSSDISSLQAARHRSACSAARRTKGESEKRVRSRFPGTTENRGCSNTRSHEGDAMARVMTRLANKPAWVDLASRDAEASRDFYSKLFGWQIEVNPDP